MDREASQSPEGTRRVTALTRHPPNNHTVDVRDGGQGAAGAMTMERPPSRQGHWPVPWSWGWLQGSPGVTPRHTQECARSGLRSGAVPRCLALPHTQ